MITKKIRALTLTGTSLAWTSLKSCCIINWIVELYIYRAHLQSSMGCTTPLWTLSGCFSSQLDWHDLLSIFALHYHTTLWALSGSFFSQLVWHDWVSITICKIVVAPNVLRPCVLGLQCLLSLKLWLNKSMSSWWCFRTCISKRPIQYEFDCPFIFL